ncbi:hypothetical protein [Streptomyces sp. NPDC051014]|uniref:hypothetical protein n=1 Tax=Streptomyces sp. NPDC051014 TaxID=3155751 RepID=UPI0033D5177B
MTAAIRAWDLGRLRWAVRSLPPRDTLAPEAIVVAATDVQLKAGLGRLSESLADQGHLDDLLARTRDPTVISVLLAPHGGPEALIGASIIDDPELPPDLLALIAGSVLPDLKTRALCRLLGHLDADVNVGLLVQALRSTPAGDVDDALLAARPGTVPGCEIHMALMADRLDRLSWIPHMESFLDVVTCWAAAMPTPPPDQIGTPLTMAEFLEGLTRSWFDQEHLRASAVASFAQLIVAPRAETLARSVFLASSLTDWPLLEQVIDSAAPVEESVTADIAEYFLTSVMPTVDRLRARGDESRAIILADLAETCARAVDGPMTQPSLDILAGLRESLTGPPRIDGVRELLAESSLFRAVWGYSQFPEDMYDVGPRVAAAEVLHVASYMGSTRRQGPLSMLLLADLAIEFGDLSRARDFVEEATELYPEHSTVLQAQRKLASHTGDVLAGDRALDELARLWASGRDRAGVHAQLKVLEELRGSRGERLARMRAGQLLGDPRFRGFRDRLEHLLR